MKTLIHRANSRGFANHGWLKAHHTFSFANYFNPERVNFGVLRVLNDDEIAGGGGFGAHPHKDMEIITIPLEGKLEHGDNMGNSGIICKGEGQVMSAGTGVVHSERNADSKEAVKLLQIWLMPRRRNVEPRYQQLSTGMDGTKDEFHQIVSPDPEDHGAWINQDAWFYMARFNKGFSKEFSLNDSSNGVHIFVIDGKLKIGDEEINTRDGIGITDAASFTVEATDDAEFLIMEVPMEVNA